uniref:CHK kinase-like domain-containing protein n=1 Tax=Schizaphis graminum TaxID=13262 RepID=A0A2S2NFP6_SCHGA
MTTTASVAVVAEMIEAGAFGPDSCFVSFALDEQNVENAHFASMIQYGTVMIGDRDGRRQNHQLVFKFKHSSPDLRAFFKNDLQFHNEKLFYERIAPFLLMCCPPNDGDTHATTPSICRYFYGRNDCGELWHRDVVVLGNETVHGYRSAVTNHGLCLDFDHLVAAIRVLAKFHSLSYRAKHVDRDKFTDLMAKVKDTQWDDEGRWFIGRLGGLISVALDKLVIRRGDDRRAQRFQTELLADASDTLKCVMKPVEPLSVLCHGDFNRNNLMFRYDDDGRPVDALAYDMATVRYGSPAIDLSFFLYMNTDRQTRDDHWDALLDAYCETLAAAAGNVLVPDRGRLDVEMREHAFYGLAHTSFFLRILLEEQKPIEPLKIGMSDDEVLMFLLSYGGERATDWIADIVQHYLDMAYSEMSP